MKPRQLLLHSIRLPEKMLEKICHLHYSLDTKKSWSLRSLATIHEAPGNCDFSVKSDLGAMSICADSYP